MMLYLHVKVIVRPHVPMLWHSQQLPVLDMVKHCHGMVLISNA